MRKRSCLPGAVTKEKTCGLTLERVWHSHWVVLVKDEACGPGALKAKDIVPFQKFLATRMPA